MSVALAFNAVARSVVDVVVVVGPMAAAVSPHHRHHFKFSKMTDLTDVS